MFIEMNVLGRTQPSHLGDLGTGRLQRRALPDEFSRSHFIKFLVQKWMANAAVNVISERRLLKQMVLLFQICPGGQEEESREKTPWSLANIPVQLQKTLGSNGTTRKCVFSDFSPKGKGESLCLNEDSGSGCQQKLQECQGSWKGRIIRFWPQNYTTPDCPWAAELQGTC